MTVLELINLLETCEDTFEVVLTGGELQEDLRVVSVEQVLENKRVRISARKYRVVIPTIIHEMGQ